MIADDIWARLLWAGLNLEAADLPRADGLNRSMQHLHGWRVKMLARACEQAAGTSRG